MGCQVDCAFPPGKRLFEEGVLCFASKSRDCAAPVSDGVSVDTGLEGCVRVGMSFCQESEDFLLGGGEGGHRRVFTYEDTEPNLSCKGMRKVCTSVGEQK